VKSTLRSSLLSDPQHGLLPILLLTLTVVTGLVDAVSVLSLGRVFVANMTGNVVFIGFALAGAPGFSLSASLFALGGFLLGAFVAGLEITRTTSSRASLFLNAVVLELILLAVSVAVAQSTAVPYSGPVRDAIAAITAVAMGIQNATARRLAVPDLTTTVLTMTLTGLAADIRNRNQPALTRRLLAVLSMLGGAIFGAELVLNVRPSAALEVAAGLLLIVVAAATLGVKQQKIPA
jgi:uncharacterized membrane protein YoaK (UPF0700 family)